MSNRADRLWTWIFGDTLREIDERAVAYVASPQGRTLDRRVVLVLMTAAACLIFRHYLGDRQWAHTLLEGARAVGLAEGTGRPRASLIDQYTYWACVRVVGYFVIPALVIRHALGGSLADYGGRLRGSFTSVGVYGSMLAIALVLVALASGTEPFLAKYPFYRPAPGEPLWPHFYRWEVVYALQFIATEFFYRGFLVHGLKHRFGTYAVLIAMVPYCMIHFGKPLPETAGAVIAGIALGLMSLKTGSVWMGALLHILVAWAMDFASLRSQGLFF